VNQNRIPSSIILILNRSECFLYQLIILILMLSIGVKCVVADVLLWKRWYASVGVLVSATTLWILFEKAGYNLLSFVANVLFLLVVILFFWAKSASLLNR